MRIGIVGCGISGAYLAWKLAKAGHDVAVFEQKKEVGGKACSGLISERMWGFVPRDESLIENEISSCILRFPKKKVELAFGPRMLVINRSGLDRHVAALAEKTGAEIHTGHKFVKVISAKRARPHMVAEAGGKTVVREFERIVGCDGANSKVREHVKAAKPVFRLGLYTFVKGKKGSTVDVRPTRHGFKWKIPRGKKVELGVVEKPENARKVFNSFVRRKGRKKMFAAVIPEGLVRSRNKRIALCGDAAGLTKPWSGGGVIWGLTSADMFVKSKCNVSKYNRMLERHFGPKIAFSKVARRAVFSVGRRAPWLLPKKVRIDSDWLY